MTGNDMRELILGGARSGKSGYAEQRAQKSGLEVVYIATAEACDQEMGARIALHRQRRPADWLTLEEPLALADTLRAHAQAERCILIDCLTLWLSNLLTLGEDRFKCEREALLRTLPSLPGQLLFVSNEVGQGIVPMNALARRFVDEAGYLHQDLAQLCERVTWVVAGLPQVLKG
ncbi:bifunctional adenosylcobinamide kinase/adenosylcobinamide-phosphate guanylyltransferase [Candidatus Methylospira mobilis]|nr:bifunctional adenosylcobinamide kinase/adenosylcobinamide-phosphate guanylyltransferase [Candidatus Methylospira mobilis]